MAVVKAETLESIYTGIAEVMGASDEEAEIWSHCMLRADLRGMYTQGAAMIPYSVWLMEQGLANFGVPFEILKDEPALALVDGHYAVGAVGATRAMDLAMKKASEAGMASVWMRNGGDFMMTANHTLQALEADMVGLVMRNEKPVVAPWGGRDPFFFTNPISVAVPTAEEPPIVIDMAGGSFSVGQTVMAARDNRHLPSPHLVTREGKYTDDATKIVIDPANRESDFDGAIVTLGHKGLAWALIVELFSGLLAGTNTSNLNNFAPTREHPWDEAQFFMAIDVSKLGLVEEFKARTDAFVRQLRAVRPAEGFDRVRAPGEAEAENEARRKREGVPIRDDDWQGVLETAARLGVEIPG
jgi:LDH2 family malate/lactate/ureidoglycolate dehydrogenase